METKYFKSAFTPVGLAEVWLFEVQIDESSFEIQSWEIKREVGLDINNKAIRALPDEVHPRGLFSDSPISFNLKDLEEINKEVFESKWNEKRQMY